MARKVFLSFVEEDLDCVNLFRGQAKNENSELEFYDYSVREPFNSKNAEYIKSQIQQKINNVSVTLCLIGKNTYTSDWVDWELKKSVEMGKGLVGMKLDNGWRNFFRQIPQALRDHGVEIVEWNHEKIIKAIERAAKKAGY